MNSTRKVRFFLLVILSVLFFTSFAGATADNAGYGFDVSIVRRPNTDNVFGASFTVTELSSNKVLMQPTIIFRAGEPGKVTSADPQTGMSFEFSVSVDPKTSVAEYKAEAIKDQITISRSQAKISLSK